MKLLESEIDQQKRIIDQQKTEIDQHKKEMNSKHVRVHNQEQAAEQSESKQPVKPASKKVGY